jgi:hypothetical protein
VNRLREVDGGASVSTVWHWGLGSSFGQSIYCAFFKKIIANHVKGIGEHEPFPGHVGP